MHKNISPEIVSRELQMAAHQTDALAGGAVSQASHGSFRTESSKPVCYWQVNDSSKLMEQRIGTWNRSAPDFDLATAGKLKCQRCLHPANQAAASRANRRADLFAVYGNLTFMRLPHITRPKSWRCSDWRAVRWGTLIGRAALRPRHVRAQSAISALESRVAHESLRQTPHRRFRRSSGILFRLKPSAASSGALPLFWRRAHAAFALAVIIPSACRSCARCEEAWTGFADQFDAHNDLWDEYFAASIPWDRPSGGPSKKAS